MKIVLILSALNIAFSSYIAQNNQKDEIIALIEKNNLSQSSDNKMFLLSCWSIKDLNSRDKNKEIQRVSKIYEQSKLAGGSNGVHFLSICTDCNALNYNIAITRDSINPQNSIYLRAEDLLLFSKMFLHDSRPDVFLYDKDWNLIRRAFKKEDVFPIMLNQITR